MVISLAMVRASSARSRQYFGSLIGTLAIGSAPRTDHGDDRALGGFQLFANPAAGHLDCRHHVAEMKAADQRVADLDDSLGFGCRIMLGLMGNPTARALKRSACRTAARIALLSADTGAIELGGRSRGRQAYHTLIWRRHNGPPRGPFSLERTGMSGRPRMRALAKSLLKDRASGRNGRPTQADRAAGRRRSVRTKPRRKSCRKK